MKTVTDNGEKLILFLLITVLISACADVANIDACVSEDPYGFWSGLWHGWIIWFSFIGSLFSDEIAVYAVNNNGGWYDFGFVIGVGGFGFSASKATK